MKKLTFALLLIGCQGQLASLGGTECHAGQRTTIPGGEGVMVYRYDSRIPFGVGPTCDPPAVEKGCVAVRFPRATTFYSSNSSVVLMGEGGSCSCDE